MIEDFIPNFHRKWRIVVFTRIAGLGSALVMLKASKKAND
jgi:hypothetical protein